MALRKWLSSSAPVSPKWRTCHPHPGTPAARRWLGGEMRDGSVVFMCGCAIRVCGFSTSRQVREWMLLPFYATSSLVIVIMKRMPYTAADRAIESRTQGTDTNTRIKHSHKPNTLNPPQEDSYAKRPSYSHIATYHSNLGYQNSARHPAQRPATLRNISPANLPGSSSSSRPRIHEPDAPRPSTQPGVYLCLRPAFPRPGHADICTGRRQGAVELVLTSGQYI
ncbi:hypothetical protein EJ06DRAFT_292932 [Trichodelitschia bisporula]|uniref:Uncharacterized protein n=1 Tax=Trichodelitschia bisporula TaxID=703511 RepID=A0A6G1I6Z4_9PEZI|nr:hypothetical protein EJ06DRAFT_292932 [Trichodelitschia bisporula]